MSVSRVEVLDDPFVTGGVDLRTGTLEMINPDLPTTLTGLGRGHTFIEPKVILVTGILLVYHHYLLEPIHIQDCVNAIEDSRQVLYEIPLDLSFIIDTLAEDDIILVIVHRDGVQRVRSILPLGAGEEKIMIMIVVLIVIGLNLDNALGESGILDRDHRLDSDVLVLLEDLVRTFVWRELPRHRYHLETYHRETSGDDVRQVALVAALTVILDGIRIVTPSDKFPTADDADFGFLLLFHLQLQLLLPTYPNQPQ